MNLSLLHRLKYWNTLFRYGFEEARFVRSFKDMGILYDKVVYLLQRRWGQRERVGIIPPGIQIEPTNYCNVQCICCSTSRSPRKRGFMELPLFQKIVDDAQQNNMKIVHLYLHGEPLLHPNIVEMVRYVKEKGLAVHMTTNGMLLTPDMSKAILNSGVDLADHFTISILGRSREIHELVMKKISHEEVLNNLDTFLTLRREMRTSGPIIETIFYPMPENEHEAPAYLQTFRGYVDHARLASKISVSFANYNMGREIPTSGRRRPCAHLREKLTVFWDGNVTLCHHDLNGEWVIGNLVNHSIQEVCNNGDLLNAQTAHITRQFEKLRLCNQCDG